MEIISKIYLLILTSSNQRARSQSRYNHTNETQLKGKPYRGYAASTRNKDDTN